MQKIFLYVLILFLSNNLCAQRIKINFVPESEKTAYAVKDYQEIWASEGDKIIDGLEKHSHLKFKEDTVITAIIYEGPSSSGFKKFIPMKLRASYPDREIKIAALSHEMGHRLNDVLDFPRSYEDHPMLFLYLYDTWVDLYGKKFADTQVAIESQRKGLYDYETAWKNTLALTAKERKHKLKKTIKELQKSNIKI